MNSNKYLIKKHRKEFENSFLRLKPRFMPLVCFSLIGTPLYANNNWTGSGISCSGNVCTIDTSVSSHNNPIKGTGILKDLIITSFGTISGILGSNATLATLENQGIIGIDDTQKGLSGQFNFTESFINSGIIRAGQNALDSTIEMKNFTNTGTISGGKYGLLGTIRGEIFTNSGIIESNSSQLTPVGAIYANMTLQNFVNSGIIRETGAAYRDDCAFMLNGGTIQTLKNTHTGTIQGSGVAVRIRGDMSFFDNQGLIQADQAFGVGVEFGKTSSITNLNNSGIIEGGIGMRILDTAIIQSLTNTGTIDAQSVPAIFLKDDSTIEILSNTGIIRSVSGDSVALAENSKIKTFNNSGTIKTTSGSGVGLWDDATIDNLNNAGIIESNTGPGMQLTENSKVKTLNNLGTIKTTSGSGISLWDNAAIDNLDNSGNLESINEYGIVLSGNSNIKIFENSGTIKSVNGSGISLWGSTTIENLNNSSIIQSVSGNGMWLTDNSKIQTIENLGTVIGGIDGIRAQANASLDSINIQDGNKVEGKTGYGINIQGGASVNGDIMVSGELKGGLGIINNSGTLGGSVEIKSSASISTTGGVTPAIVNRGGGFVKGSIKNEGSQDLSLENQGYIAKGIVNASEATMYVTNSGMVSEGTGGYMVENTGSGKIQIRSWEVDNDEFGIPGELSVGGSGAQNVFVDTLVLDQGGLDLDNLDKIDYFINGISHSNVKNVTTNGPGDIKLSYDPSTGKLGSSIDLNEGVAGVVSRDFTHIQARRLNFIDAVMASSMQTLHYRSRTHPIASNHTDNLYASAKDLVQNDALQNASYTTTRDSSLFVLPYFSSINIDLNSNQKSKGHTQGVILGYHIIKNSGIWGFYAGYEDTKTTDAHYFDVSARTYYAGLKYFNTLYRSQKGHEIYVKAGTNLGKVRNDLTKDIGKNNIAKAHPNSYVYGVNSDVGVNLSYGKNMFLPEVGLAYDGSYTQAFSMENVSGDALVKGGERYYANKINVFSSRVSMSWFRDWLPKLKTAIQAGIKLNFNPQVKLKARLGKHVVDDHYDLPANSKFTRTSLIIPLNDAFTFTVNYHGSFSNQGKNHSVYTQFNYFY